MTFLQLSKLVKVKLQKGMPGIGKNKHIKATYILNDCKKNTN